MPRHFRWLLVPILALSLQTSRADAPVGTLDYVFDSTTPLVDVSGGYVIAAEVLHPDGIPVEMVFGVNVTQDSGGRLSGVELVFVELGDDFFVGVANISGQVSTSGGVPRVRMNIRITGNSALIAGRPVSRFQITTRVVGDVDVDSGEIFGSARTTAKFTGLGKAAGRTDELALTLPENMDGSWTLTLTVAPGIRPLAGSGLITLSNGRQLNFKLSGNYAGRSDTSRIQLKGIGDNSRSNLRLTLDGFLDIVGLNGKVLGQRVR